MILLEARITPKKREVLIDVISSISEKYANLKLDKEQVENALELLVEADPTPNGKYLNWMIGVWLKDYIYVQGAKWYDRMGEDLYKVSEPLEVFYDNLPTYKKKNINIDINYYRSLDELEEITSKKIKKIVRGLANSPIELVNNRALIDQGDAKLIYEDNDRMFVDILSFEAAKFYGSYTSWCTTRRGNYERYSSSGPLIVDIDKNITIEEEKDYEEYGYEEVIISNAIQFCFTGNVDEQQIMDADDRPVEPDEYLRDLTQSQRDALYNYFEENYRDKKTKYTPIQKFAVDMSDSDTEDESGAIVVNIEKYYESFMDGLDSDLSRMNSVILDYDGYYDDVRFSEISNIFKYVKKINEIVATLIKNIYPNHDSEKIYNSIFDINKESYDLDEISEPISLYDFRESLSNALMSLYSNANSNFETRVYLGSLEEFYEEFGFDVINLWFEGVVLKFKLTDEGLEGYLRPEESMDDFRNSVSFNRIYSINHDRDHAQGDDYDIEFFIENLIEENDIFRDALNKS
jgi:hypothetical protein